MARLEENAKAVVWLTIGLGGVCGLIDAVAHPRGGVWVAARVIVSVVFAVAVGQKHGRWFIGDIAH